MSAWSHRDRLVVSWTPVEDATYKVYIAATTNETPVFVTTTASAFTETGIPPGTDRFYSISAVVDGLEYGPTGRVPARTPERTQVLGPPAWTWASQDPFASVGRSVAVDDFNGDGWLDLVVSAPELGSVTGNLTHIHIFFGSVEGFPSEPSYTIAALQNPTGYGFVVVAAGFVDDDAYPDLVVGIPFHDGTPPGGTLGGGYDVLYGGPGTSFADTSGFLGPDGALLGFSAAGIGDWNGDGFDEIAVGAPGRDGTGAVHWIREDAGVLTDTVGRFGPGSGSRFGQSVAAISQTSGLPKLAVVGAPGSGNGQVGVFGPGWFFRDLEDDPTGPGGFGAVVAAAGDVDNVVRPDFLVGTFTTASNTAFSHLYLGSSAAWARASWMWETALSPGEGATLPLALAGAGDVNGDEFDDVLVGESAVDFRGQESGRVLLFLGTGGGLAAQPVWEYFGEMPGARLGSFVSSAQDVDFDGYADFVVGAPGFDEGSGLVHLFRGRSLEGPIGPIVDAGLVEPIGRSEAAQLLDAYFVDPLGNAGPYTCVLRGGDEMAVLESCSNATLNLSTSLQVTFPAGGRFPLQLMVISRDGRLGSSVVAQEVR